MKIITIPGDVHHRCNDDNEPLCGVAYGPDVDTQTMTDGFATCEECDAAFLRDFGNACLHGSIPNETQVELIALAFRYQQRYNDLRKLSHRLLSSTLSPAEYQSFCDEFPKQLLFWQRWARGKLRHLVRRGEVEKYPDLVIELEAILEQGRAPHVTLKSMVNLLGEGEEE